MRYRGGILAIGLAFAAAACGSPGPVTVDGISLLRRGVMNGYPAALFTGTVHFRDGCVWADSATDTQVMVWPPSATLVRGIEGQLVLVVDGIELEDGDSFSIGGGQFDDIEFIRSLAGGIPEACRAGLYWLGSEMVP